MASQWKWPFLLLISCLFLVACTAQWDAGSHASSGRAGTVSTRLRKHSITDRPSAAACPQFREYTRFHHAVLSGKVTGPRRRFLVTSDVDGLADRLVNAVSMFYFALLTQRVLCIQPASEKQPGFETAFDSPHIDWTCKGMTNPFPDEELWNPTHDDVWMWPETDLYRNFTHHDLNTIGPANATTIRMLMHRGITVSLFFSPHHARQMTALGLRPDTAFGCAVNYLFRLNSASLAPLQNPEAMDLLRALTSPNGVSIGIQVRLGDDNILDQPQKPEDLPEKTRTALDGFVRCATQLQNDLALHTGLHTSAVVWYVMTDTLAVRRYIAQARARVEAGDEGQQGADPNGSDTLVGSSLVRAFEGGKVEFFKEVTEAGFRLTSLEHWLFSQCQYHVFTANSGMGRTAAFSSLRYGTLFSIEHDTGNRIDGRGCTLVDHDRPLDVYNTWSGV